MTTNAPVQGQVQAGPPSFRDQVVGDNVDAWMALPQQDKAEVAGTFFKKHYEQNKDFRALSRQDQAEIRTEFYKSQVIDFKPDPQLTTQPKQRNLLENVRDFGLGTVAGLGESFSFVKPLVGQKPFKASEFDIAQNNPAFGAGATLGNVAGILDTGLLGTMATGNPFIGFGAPSAVRNIQDVQGGYQNAGQATFNTLLDAGLAGYAPAAKTLFGGVAKNAALGAAGGAAGVAGNQALTGQPINLSQIGEAAKNEGLLQAIIAGALNRGKPVFSSRPKPQPQVQPNVKGRNVSSGEEFGRLMVDPTGRMVRRLNKTIPARVEKAVDIGSTRELTNTRTQLEKIALSDTTPQAVRDNAKQLLGVVDRGSETLKGPKATPEQVAAGKKEKAKAKFRAKQIKEKQKAKAKAVDDARVKRLKVTEQKQQEAQANRILIEKAKARKQAKAEKAVSQAKERQAVRENKEALKGSVTKTEKAGIKKQFEAKQKESTGVKPSDVKSVKTPQKGRLLRSEKGERYGKGLTAGQVRFYVPDNTQAYFKAINRAIRQGKQVRIYVRNERVGETSSVPFRDVSPLSYQLSKDGTVFLEAINPDGQFRAYVMKKSSRVGKEGHFKQPEILDTPAVAEPIETGRGSEVAIPTSVREAVTKYLPELNKKIKAGQLVTVSDIVEAATRVDDKALDAFTKALPDKQRKIFYKKITGKDC